MYRFLKDLDDELLSELDSICHDNQMACFPVSRGRNSDDYMLEKYPELVTVIEHDKQKRIDSMKIKSRIDQVEAQEGKTRQASSEKTPSKTKAPAAANIASSPVLKSKQSTSDLMFQMDEEATLLSPGDSMKGKAAIRGPADGRPYPVESSPMLGSSLVEEESFGERSFLDGQMASPQDTLLAESPSESRAGALQRKKDGFVLSPAANSSSAAPWGSPVLTPSKKDLKDIMAETSDTQVSNLSLGMSKEARREGSGNFTPKLSQKERKKIQQQQMQERLAAEQKPKEAPQNPWKMPPPAANKTPVKAEPLAGPSQSTRPVQKPAMTLRQTVAGAPPAAKPTPNRSVSANTPSPSPLKPSTASGPSSSTTAIPFPSLNQSNNNNSNTSAYPSLPPPTQQQQQQQPPPIQSVRHIPRPEPLYQPGFHTPPSSNSLSLAAILMQQQTEKDEIREAATAKHNLQEIQAEQEFQEWWEKESRRVQGLPDPDADAEPASQDGRSGGSRGGGGRGKGSTPRNNNSGNKKRGGGGGGGGSGGGRGRGDKAPASALTQQLSRQRSDNNAHTQPRAHTGSHPDGGSGGGNARRGGGSRGGARGRGKERARV